MKRLIATVSLGLLILQSSNGCTAFCICSENRAILAKNLDWPVDAGFILVNRAGIQKKSFSSTANAVCWTSLYTSITFNQFGSEFPLGGMNEKGLVVEELNMPAVQSRNDLSKQMLNEFQLVQYMLDNFSSLEELRQAMEHFQTVPILLSLHYLIMDREGSSLIMEFDGTAFSFFHPDQTGFPVLSNNPYQESLRYIRNFQGFGGNQEVLHRSGSNERFVSVSSMLRQESPLSPVRRSFEILDTVEQSDTRWTIVYDATRLTIHVKFHACTDIREIQLEKFLLMEGLSTLGADISDCALKDAASFRPVSVKENEEQVRKVVKLLSEEMDLSSRKNLFENLIAYSNHYIIE